jgi:hypothetical protein
VIGRRGFDLDAPWLSYPIGAHGQAVIRAEELDRVELALGARGSDRYSGYVRIGSELGALPIGSRLDPITGAFAWTPGVGFVGAYNLVFVRSRGDRAIARTEVRVILQPKRGSLVGPQVVIDAPRSQEDVAQPFVVSGWAADLGTREGTGVATIHAWAYPLAGGPPVFLGAATYGVQRPDVAATHGEQFGASGFNLPVQGLVDGNYDLAVFAWDSATGQFAPATVVRVTVR